MAAARRAEVVIMSRCPVTYCKPLIGQNRECYIVEEVIEVDEHDKSNLKSAAAGKQQVNDHPRNGR